VYLEPIFQRGALPQEQSRFDRIDADFRSIMQQVNANTKVMALGESLSTNAFRLIVSYYCDRIFSRSISSIGMFVHAHA
jgi:hypothetical protein